MVIKRRKIGSQTITVNTRTGKQTTSTSNKSGNIRVTTSQSNQGDNRRTITNGIGNGWFDRKTKNLNKKIPKSKKSSWTWFGSCKSDSKTIESKSKPSTPTVDDYVSPYEGRELIILCKFLWFVIKWTVVLAFVIAILEKCTSNL